MMAPSHLLEIPRPKVSPATRRAQAVDTTCCNRTRLTLACRRSSRRCRSAQAPKSSPSYRSSTRRPASTASSRCLRERKSTAGSCPCTSTRPLRSSLPHSCTSTSGYKVPLSRSSWRISMRSTRSSTPCTQPSSASHGSIHSPHTPMRTPDCRPA